MKKIAYYAMLALGVSSVANAAPVDSVRNGTTYGVYSARMCGFEVEKDGNQLILTSVNNPLSSSTPCGDIGKITYLNCSSTTPYCSIAGINNDHAFRILPDGNFIMDSVNGDQKFIAIPNR